jgi:hypothetical protein
MAWAAVLLGACGGTTGREGLPSSGSAGTTGDAAGGDATSLDGTTADADLDAGEQDDSGFDVSIEYADRVLPDVSAPAEGGPEAGDLEASSGGLAPCTADGQTACVQCQGNVADDAGQGAGVCTPTEALFVAYDIAQGYATAPGPDPTSGCYTCLYEAGALDDTEFADTGNECGDLPTQSFTAGNGDVGGYQAICLSTLQCILGTHCAALDDAGTNNISDCYCGSAGGSASECLGSSRGPLTNGPCKTAETNGFAAMPDDSTSILDSFNDVALPSGKANQFFVASYPSVCPQCLQ